MQTIWSNLKREYRRFEKERLVIIDMSSEIRRASKQLIHSTLHHSLKNASTSIAEIKKRVDDLQRIIHKNPYLYQVGAAHEGLEEYAEAVFLVAYMQGDENTLKFLPADLSHEVLMGGIADASGELARLVQMKMDISEAQKVHTYIARLYEHFLDLEVSRNSRIRSKVGEIHRNLIRVEEIIFNLKLKESWDKKRS